MRCRNLVSTVTIGIVLCFFCMWFLPFPIAADNPLKVAICADLPLLHYEDEAGILSGMHIDMLDYIAAQEGYKIEYTVFKRTSEAIDALENRKVDLVLGAFPIDVPKGMDVQFTEALSSASVCEWIRCGKRGAASVAVYAQNPLQNRFGVQSVQRGQYYVSAGSESISIGHTGERIHPRA